MKLPMFADWLLKHFTPEPLREQLAGDLLEEMHAGRSPLWVWRQTLAAVSIGKRSMAAHYVQIALFSFAASTPVPTLMMSWRHSAFFLRVWERAIQLDWPTSALTTLLLELAPVLLPFWTAIALYVLLIPRAYRPTKHRALPAIARGWLTTLPAFLLAGFLLMHFFGQHGTLHRAAPRMEALNPLSLPAILYFVPSLFLSLIAALPLPPRPPLRANR
ncbi:hypothetical protein [Silvibacterium dinghuense]|uniref:Uncharacterized protein n=1 Tax=Silvibacterium dinghuense TaxID=1560006 RepID=A0A4Q1SIG3_9BACT|nr:hypothetical protein [Silvibacterium dinghuense]RXS97187.1 hypothetical protein ESZ00_04535 [Silvibacterium dinghuense]GGG96922.1 hypothetical protein GCM10011586_10210 [Silvibacterium dinghuense]